MELSNENSEHKTNDNLRLLKERIKERKLKTPRKKIRRTGDKIFDNSYNRGDIDFEEFGKVEIDVGFQQERLNQYYNAQEYYRLELLSDNLTQIYKDSKWYKFYNIKKKVPKQDLSELYTFLRLEVEDESYTETEIFVTIAEILDVNYNILYEMILPIFKRDILEIMDQYYSVIKNKRLAKLF